MHDLLHDPLISVRLPPGDARLNLPELLAALARGEVLAYTRLRRHQSDPFHVFTVQLAASILARRGQTEPPDDPVFWRDGLLELADGQTSAWHLIEADPTKPAFMQSPCPKVEDFAAYKPKATSPDELDVLITAKDHDVKMARGKGMDAELWLYALLTIQTTGGYLMHYQASARINTGLGSRAIVTTVRDPRPGPRFVEELPIVNIIREQALRTSFGYRSPGVVLTWLKPRPLKQSQYGAYESLEPLFVEAVRPVRLMSNKDGLMASMAADVPNQIGLPKTAQNGDTGDPWTTLNMEDKKKGASALTVSGQGFTPKLLTDLIFQRGYRLTPLQQARSGKGATRFCASVLVRGQGKTDGFHAVEITIPERARQTLLQAAQRDSLAQRAQEWLNDAANGAKCLRAALMALAEGGPAETDFGKDTVTRWAEVSQRDYVLAWREDYFPSLWLAAEPEADLKRLRAHWAGKLMSLARGVLDKAEQTLPIPAARRLRARVRAEGLLENLFRKHGLADLAKGGNP